MLGPQAENVRRRYWSPRAIKHAASPVPTRRTSGGTTTTDTSSQHNPGKSEGRPKETSPRSKRIVQNGLPGCGLLESPCLPDRATVRSETGQQPSERDFMLRTRSRPCRRRARACFPRRGKCACPTSSLLRWTRRDSAGRQRCLSTNPGAPPSNLARELTPGSSSRGVRAATTGGALLLAAEAVVRRRGEPSQVRRRGALLDAPRRCIRIDLPTAPEHRRPRSARDR
jgi:hypothetical protein